MDWKTIVNKSLENDEIKPVKKEIKPKVKVEEDDNSYCRNPDFEFDYKYSEKCYNGINRFKKYISRMNEPLFDLDINFTTDLYNFIKYNSYEYIELIRDIENESEEEDEDSDDNYYDEIF